MTIETTLGVVVAVATALSSLATVIYARLTHLILRAMRKQQAALLRPYINVYAFMPPQEPRLYLRIENVGRSAATNLQLHIDKDFYKHGHIEGVNLANLPPFQRPVPSFAPGMELCYVLTASLQNPTSTPPQFTVRATYSYGEEHFDEAFRIDLETFLQSNAPPDPVQAQLEMLRRVLETGLRSIASSTRMHSTARPLADPSGPAPEDNTS